MTVFTDYMAMAKTEEKLRGIVIKKTNRYECF